jgi:hypothetical protein
VLAVIASGPSAGGDAEPPVPEAPAPPFVHWLAPFPPAFGAPGVVEDDPDDAGVAPSAPFPPIEVAASGHVHEPPSPAALAAPSSPIDAGLPS